MTQLSPSPRSVRVVRGMPDGDTLSFTERAYLNPEGNPLRHLGSVRAPFRSRGRP